MSPVRSIRTRKALYAGALLCAVAALASCTPLILLLNGGKRPSVVNTEAVSKEAKQLGVAAQDSYRLAPPALLADSSRFRTDTVLFEAYVQSLQDRGKFFGLEKEIILFFDDEGKLLDTRQGARCNGNVGETIDSLATYVKSDFTYDPRMTFDSLAVMMANMDGTPFDAGAYADKDYNVVIPWAMWKSKGDKKDVMEYYRKLKKLEESGGDLDISVHMVNFDPHESWMVSFLELKLSRELDTSN